MWKLIKTEIQYSLSGYVMMIILPLLFTVYILFGHPNMNEENVVTRIFWPMTVGFLPILVSLKLWFVSFIKENRERKINLLAVTKQEIAIGRVITAVFPVVCLLIYMAIVHIILISDWPGIIYRIFTQIGITFLIGAALLLTYDLHLIFTPRVSYSMFATGIIVFLVVILIMTIIDQLFFDQLLVTFAPGIGLIIFSFACIVLVLDTYIYRKKLAYIN